MSTSAIERPSAVALDWSMSTLSWGLVRQAVRPHAFELVILRRHAEEPALRCGQGVVTGVGFGLPTPGRSPWRCRAPARTVGSGPGSWRRAPERRPGVARAPPPPGPCWPHRGGRPNGFISTKQRPAFWFWPAKLKPAMQKMWLTAAFSFTRNSCSMTFSASTVRDSTAPGGS